MINTDDIKSSIKPMIRGKKDIWFHPAKNGVRISIPMHFKSENNEAFQANAFQQPFAKSTSLLTVKKHEQGEYFTGLRCDSIEFIPHCHGTHTEGVGHISSEKISIGSVVEGHETDLYRAVLITVKPEKFQEVYDESYMFGQKDDWIMTKTSIEKQLQMIGNIFFESLQAIIIRCDYYNILKKPYNKFNNPPYYSEEAMNFVSDLFPHHLTTLPSIDRENDNGTLRNHCSFFRLPLNRDAASLFDQQTGKIADYYKRTNTEMCFIPMEIPDGNYLLHLNIQHNWELDHAISCPMIYEPRVVDKENLIKQFTHFCY